MESHNLRDILSREGSAERRPEEGRRLARDGGHFAGCAFAVGSGVEEVGGVVTAMLSAR